MVWALKHAPVTDAQEHLVLIGLADHADGLGRGAWPSKATLAEYARCSARTVHNKLRRLEDAGIIMRGDQRIVGHVRADRRPVVYDLDIHGRNLVHPVASAHGGNEVPPVTSHGVNEGTHGVNERVVRGEQASSHGVNAVADKPSLNRTEPYKNHSPSPATPSTPCAGSDPVAEAFDAFWSSYPRKVGKQAARKALVAVVRQIAKEGGSVDLAAIVDGARRMAADPNLPEARFVPHAATWLNQRRWDDPPYPPRTDGAKRSTTDDRVTEAMDVARRLAAQESGQVPAGIEGPR